MDDRSGQIIAVNVLFMVLCTVTVGLRVFCRGWIIRSFGVDDWLMLVTWLLFMSYLTTQLLGVRFGTGRHRADLDADNNSRALMWWLACELFYISCTSVLKISVGFFLLRIAVNPKHIWTLRILLVSTAVFGLAYFFMVVFQCSPVSSFWEQNPRAEGHCIPEKALMTMTYTASCLNCVADWTFGILPAFIVWSLTMSLKNKILVAAILSFAAVGSSATIFRSTVLWTLMDGDDFLYATTDVAIWSTVEPGIGIAAASMATLRPLFQLLSYKTGFSQNGPSNPAWRQRNRGHGRSRSGYTQTGEFSSTRMQRFRPDLYYAATTVSAEDSKAAHHCTIEAAQSGTPRGQLGDTQMSATAVRKTIEVTITNSGTEPTEEYHLKEVEEDGERTGEVALPRRAGVRLC
ncbi:hypothetical protein BR93DRAFT_12679 [Coniochaeta sp. PMI_546]|nr:hypothetical protein BR93DRAFT_12679 [Coniochaeta sp. PMI_546]